MEEHRGCLTCGLSLPLESFTKHKQARGGYLSHCKKCLATKSKAYKALDPDKWRALDRLSKANDESRLADKLRKREAYRKDPKRFQLRNQTYYKKNLIACKIAVKTYRTLNKAKFCVLGAERRARERTATPPWLTKDQRKEILGYYERSRELTITTGVCHEVDHMVPLQGKTVCGLHVPWNLQVLTKSDNVRKSNTLWPHMWGSEAKE